MKNVLLIVRDLWKGFILVTLSVVLLVSSLLIPFHSFLPAWMHRDGSYIIKPGEYRSLSIGLLFGGIVRGMLVISGEDDYINFSVKDSSGKPLIEEEVGGRYFYEFQPDKTDSYVLLLDNRGYSAEKSIYWIVWGYYYNILFLLSGTSLFIVGIIAMLIEEKRLSSIFAEALEGAKKQYEQKGLKIEKKLQANKKIGKF